MIGIHTFTGCDTVSDFTGKEKVHALKMVIGSIEAQEVFSQLGMNWTVSAQLMEQLEKFTCNLYYAKSPTYINELQYHLFCIKKAQIESFQLPPCLDTLTKHAERANYQAAIWQRCFEQSPSIPSPVGHGWKIIEGEDDKQVLEIEWMSGLPAPQAVLDLLACTCRKNKCKLPTCECMINQFKCTDMCKCKAECGNCEEVDEEDEEDEDDVGDNIYDIFDD